MNFQIRREESVEVNITPLIDVVFLLLIFFMVSTSFQHESEIDVTLPRASQEARLQQVDTIRVTIDADSAVYVNDQRFTRPDPAELERELQRQSMDMEEPVLLINADAQATHQTVVLVMDAARRLGLRRVSFATQVEASP